MSSTSTPATTVPGAAATHVRIVKPVDRRKIARDTNLYLEYDDTVPYGAPILAIFLDDVCVAKAAAKRIIRLKGLALGRHRLTVALLTEEGGATAQATINVNIVDELTSRQTSVSVAEDATMLAATAPLKKAKAKKPRKPKGDKATKVETKVAKVETKATVKGGTVIHSVPVAAMRAIEASATPVAPASADLPILPSRPLIRAELDEESSSSGSSSSSAKPSVQPAPPAAPVAPSASGSTEESSSSSSEGSESSSSSDIPDSTSALKAWDFSRGVLTAPVHGGLDDVESDDADSDSEHDDTGAANDGSDDDSSDHQLTQTVPFYVTRSCTIPTGVKSVFIHGNEVIVLGVIATRVKEAIYILNNTQGPVEVRAINPDAGRDVADDDEVVVVAIQPGEHAIIQSYNKEWTVKSTGPSA